MVVTNKKYLMAAFGIVLIILFLARSIVFNGANAEGPPDGGPPQGPAPVQVSIVKPEQAEIWLDFSGRMEAVNSASIRPQVSGTIAEVKIIDGQNVKKDDVLFIIDPRTYEAAVNQAKADLDVAKNQAEFARQQFARAQDLIKTDAISKKIYDERKSANNIAKAAVEAATARLKSAEVNLDYAYVKAPFDARVSRAEITAGNVVQAGPNAPVLTTLISSEGLYADFEVDEQTYIKMRALAQTNEDEQKIPVRVVPAARESTAVHGKIYAFDNQINPKTGTIRARALFDNSDQMLLPGMFVKVSVGLPQDGEQIVISEKAIGTDQNRKFVLVVNDKNIIEHREVTIGASMGGKRVVESGLKGGEKVIVEGLIKLRPGMPVEPKIISGSLNAPQTPSSSPSIAANPEQKDGLSDIKPAAGDEPDQIKKLKD